VIALSESIANFKNLNSFELLPYIVSKGSEFNFAKFADSIAETWESSEDSFNEGFFKTSISKAIIFKTVERLVSEQKGNWFKGGHRDKIVPYTISFIENAIRKFNKDFNYYEIWNKQSTSRQLDKLINIVAERVNDLLNDPNRPIFNVGEYAKREACWRVIKSESDQFDIEQYLDLFVDRKQLEEGEMKSRIKQKLLKGREMVQMVLSIEPKEWEAVRDFLSENSMMTEDKLTLIKQAIYKRQPLSERQCKALYSLFIEYNSYFRE
jgi:hypothetical protein